ncbi:hypothetical protein VX159_10575 [Dechloromonas sp. ZY10]|uniref:hypothetical protein n=1 Tax=Dechloromonas aquae TaxID=2664436 RepID=UPI003526F12C
MQSRVTVVASETRKALYPSKSGGAPREVTSHVCKVILFKHDGTIDVSTMKVPEALAPNGVTPGDYLVDYCAGRSFKEDAMVGVMCTFERVGGASVASSIAEAQQQSAKAAEAKAAEAPKKP